MKRWALAAVASLAVAGLFVGGASSRVAVRSYVNGPVAYVGCSVAELSVHGYHVVGGTRMWPQNTKYNGGVVHVWAGASNQYWSAFDSMNAAQPGAQQVWWLLCVYTNTSRAQLAADAKTVLAKIHARLPGATVYATALGQYVYPDHVCPSTGTDGLAAADAEVATLVGNGEVQAGPKLAPLPLADTYPTQPCHPNFQGQKLEGNVLEGFFG
jgi:hypothetical protein